MGGSNVIFLVAPGMFLCFLLFVEVGRRLGARQTQEETERERATLNSVQAAIYGLLGLMIAFTFSGAASRFDTRRTLTVEEGNAIGTAYLRLDLLPSKAQPPLREKFRRYTETRLNTYRTLPDIAASSTHAARANALQTEIWAGAVLALKDAEPSSALLVLPALNHMIDITTSRAIMQQTHTPTMVLMTLFVLTTVCSLLIGNGLARKRTYVAVLHAVGFALVLTATLFVILDLDYPRAGFIQLDYVDQALTSVLAGMR